jgi:hypothetical protein
MKAIIADGENPPRIVDLKPGDIVPVKNPDHVILLPKSMQSLPVGIIPMYSEKEFCNQMATLGSFFWWENS